MATLHLVSGFHGHIGKSTYAGVLEHVLTGLGLNVFVVDGDYQKQAISKLYGQATKQVIFSSDPDFSDAPDEILNIADGNPDAHIVVDLAADTDKFLNQWLEDRGLLEAGKEAGIELYKWWVSDLDDESLSTLAARALRKDMADVHHILVKSHYSGRAELWPGTLATHAALNSAIEAGKVQHIDFFRGFGKLVAHTQSQGLTWNEVIADTEFKLINRLNYASLRRWLEKNREVIAQVYQPVIPVSEPGGGDTELSTQAVSDEIVKPNQAELATATAADSQKKTTTKTKTARKSSTKSRARKKSTADATAIQ